MLNYKQPRTTLRSGGKGRKKRRPEVGTLSWLIARPFLPFDPVFCLSSHYGTWSQAKLQINPEINWDRRYFFNANELPNSPDSIFVYVTYDWAINVLVALVELVALYKFVFFFLEVRVDKDKQRD